MDRRIQFFLVCLAVASHSLSLGQTIPETGEDLVSEARGFGAIKILARSDSIRDELALTKQQSEMLADLLNLSVDRFSDFDQPRKDRSQVVSELDDWVDVRIKEIIGEEKAVSFSRSVVSKRLRGELTAVFFAEGVSTYLGCEDEVALLKKEFVEYASRENNGPGVRRSALIKMASEVSNETEDQLRDLLGEAVIPNDGTRNYPSAGAFPRLKAFERGDVLLALLANPEIVKNLRVTPPKIDLFVRIAQELRTAVDARMRAETRMARQEKRPSRVNLVREEALTEAGIALREMLTDEQLDMLAQQYARGQALVNLKRFFANSDVATQIGNREDLLHLSNKAQVIESQIADEEREFAKRQIQKFVENLDASSRERLSRLVELDAMF